MQHDASAGAPSHSRGRLIFLMGPSGSGKDSVIDHSRPALAGLGVAIVRRVITRSAEAIGEEAHSVSLQQFLALREQGAFALDWAANGLRYGIPAEIDTWLAEGRWVLVNGSRGHLQEAREKYSDLLPILITVGTDALRHRLTVRGRESEAQIEERLARNQWVPGELGSDVRYLDNSTTLAEAAQRLLILLREAGLTDQKE